MVIVKRNSQLLLVYYISMQENYNNSNEMSREHEDELMDTMWMMLEKIENLVENKPSHWYEEIKQKYKLSTGSFEDFVWYMDTLHNNGMTRCSDKKLQEWILHEKAHADVAISRGIFKGFTISFDYNELDGIYIRQATTQINYSGNAKDLADIALAPYYAGQENLMDVQELTKPEAEAGGYNIDSVVIKSDYQAYLRAQQEHELGGREWGIDDMGDGVSGWTSPNMGQSLLKAGLPEFENDNDDNPGQSKP